MKNLIAVLHRNQLIFKKEAIMAQRDHIVLCVMLLMHLSQFDFKDQPSCRCYISSLPPSDQSNEIVGNDVHVNFPRNTLLVTSLIEFPENTGPVTFWQHIFTSDLSVSNYCPESVLAGGKWGEYAGLYLFDQNLCLVENWKLGLLNA